MYTNEELLMFANILKRNCQNNICIDCPFSIISEDNGEYLDCKIGSKPEYWISEEQ